MPVTTLNGENFAQSYGTGTSVTSTTTANYVSSAIGVAFTPKSTGNILILTSGLCGNTTTGDGINIVVYRSTAAIPANNATATGTALSCVFNFTALTGNLVSGFSTQDLDTPTIGTAYNYYIAYEAVTGGTASIGTGNTKPSIIVVEL
jgi:hypothetical protein